MGQETDGFAHSWLEGAAVGGVLETVGGEDLAEGEECGECSCRMSLTLAQRRNVSGVTNLFLNTMS